MSSVYTRSSTKSPKLQAAKKVNCHFSRLSFAVAADGVWQQEKEICRKIWILMGNTRQIMSMNIERRARMMATFSHIVYILVRVNTYIHNFFTGHRDLRGWEYFSLIYNFPGKYRAHIGWQKVSKSIIRCCS